MSIFNRQKFIDRTARKPSGQTSRCAYTNPRGHYSSFRIILNLLALKPEDQYMEIGCGGGILLRSALETASFGAGIDHSPDMVEVSRENNAQAIESGRAQVVQGDVADLPWDDERFSAAASANMFFFVEEPEKALAEVYRVLRSGGRFAMVTSADTLPVRLTLGWLYQLKSYSNEEMTEMLLRAGFCDIRVETRRFFSQVCFARKSEETNT
ncbi:MAG: methyltransferase type 11 [Deltaproteobacteria bacterium]|nr:MAG: methyltransferase type 11 [Deltaproteobacteria bacterium]PIE75004.1 MAG: methyltransferase type 11 [Deltaproteobacteria bacterium]